MNIFSTFLLKHFWIDARNTAPINDSPWFAYLGMLLIGISILSAQTLQQGILVGAVASDYYKSILIATALPLLTALWLVVKGQGRGIRIHAPIWGLALVVCWIVLSSLWAFNLSLAWIACLRFIAAFFVLLYFCQTMTTRKAIEGSMIILLIATTLMSLLGLVQYLGTGINPLFDYFASLIGQAVPPASTYGNRNMAMGVVVLVMPLALYFFTQSRTFGGALLATLPIVVMVGHLLHSDNRTSYIAMLVEIALSAWFLYRYHQAKRQIADAEPSQEKPHTNPHPLLSPSKQKVWAALLAFLLLSFIANLGPGLHFKSIWSTLNARVVQENYSSNTENSFKHRLELSNTTLTEMIPSHPILGVGVGNWTVYFSPYNNQVGELIQPMDASNPGARVLYKQTHDEYLQYIAETGLIGFVLMAFFLFIVILLWLRLAKLSRGDHPGSRLLWQVCLVGLSGTLFTHAASFPLHISTPILIIVFYLSVASYFVARYQFASSDTSETRAEGLPGRIWQRFALSNLTLRLSPWLIWLLVLVLCVMSWFAYHSYSTWMKAQALRNQGAQYASIPVRAIGILNHSLQVDPGDPDDTGYSLGSMYLRLGKFNLASKAYNHLIATALPWHPYAHARLIEIYQRSNQPEKAVAAAKRAIIGMPLQSIYYVYLGNVYTHPLYRNDPYYQELAVQYLEKGLQLGYDQPQKIAVVSLINNYRAKVPKGRYPPLIKKDLAKGSKPYYDPDKLPWQLLLHRLGLMDQSAYFNHTT